MTLKQLSAFMDESYKKTLIDRLSIEPYLAKMVREERERKEKMISDSLRPFRRWLVLRFKWRWLLRAYRIEEHETADKRVYKLYKGKKMLGEESFDYGPPIQFKRYSSLGE